MGTPKISTFIIALIWISFFATVFGVFLANLTANYDAGATFSESNITVFNKLEDLNDEAQNYQAQTDIEERDLIDIIGGYFSSAYKVLKTTTGSFDIFFEMTNSGLDELDLGVTGSALRTAILTSVIIFLFLGVLVSAIVKKDI